MSHTIITIVLYTFKEAILSRVLWILLGLALAGLVLVQFLGSIAITEKTAIQLGVLAALWRIAAVFLVGVFVIASHTRELADKGVELLFSLPVDRSVYYLGKLGGFTLVAVVATLVVTPLLLVHAPPVSVAIWSLSLICELILVVALSLFLVFTFSHLTTALSGLIGIYVLARSIDSFQLMATGPFYDQSSFADHFIATFLQFIAYLLPSLSLFSRTEWLTSSGASIDVLVPVLVQTLVYATLISAGALFDLYRKSV